ncbi:hypothetical protein K443DRAFT_220913 [Laccaria amethystina LaAM-08-1]|uniref:Uncharacterized protein n=1 Tax=Laccaria amethystina LaAM-08-1 TaxID=1095629 RepID=A0A0C9XQ65_9AGAR|nr:hypothetical protein K443DRAFT_220913 [Laccaria amethystina LaAM-08-1]
MSFPKASSTVLEPSGYFSEFSPWRPSQILSETHNQFLLADNADQKRSTTHPPTTTPCTLCQRPKLAKIAFELCHTPQLFVFAQDRAKSHHPRSASSEGVQEVQMQIQTRIQIQHRIRYARVVDCLVLEETGHLFFVNRMRRLGLRKRVESRRQLPGGVCDYGPFARCDWLVDGNVSSRADIWSSRFYAGTRGKIKP